jgi:hypothetical protein
VIALLRPRRPVLAFGNITPPNMRAPRLLLNTRTNPLGNTLSCLCLLAFTCPSFGESIALQLRVQPWSGYTIESSPDLNQWTSGKRGFTTNASLDVVISNWATLPVQFFRAQESSNDHFTNRFDIEDFPATVYGSDVNATLEPGEPDLGFGQTVWWTWTAPRRSTVGICIAGTDFNADLRVYTGNALQT